MNYCFLNGAAFGDCAQVYSHYERYVQLKNCSTDTTYHLNDLKLINKTGTVKSQIIPENKLIFIRSNKDCFYSEISDKLSVHNDSNRKSSCKHSHVRVSLAIFSKSNLNSFKCRELYSNS